MVIKNYYNILGIRKDASTEMIRERYRSLAIIYHPDKNEGDKISADKFNEINEAHETLIDPDKRRAYDNKLNQFQSAEKDLAILQDGRLEIWFEKTREIESGMRKEIEKTRIWIIRLGVVFWVLGSLIYAIGYFTTLQNLTLNLFIEGTFLVVGTILLAMAGMFSLRRYYLRF